MNLKDSLVIKSICYNESYSNTHVIMNDTNAIIIDASITPSELKCNIGDRKLDAIFITHAHFDHIIYLKELVDAFSCEVYMAHNAYFKLNNPNLNASTCCDFEFSIELPKSKLSFVENNQIIDWLGNKIEVLSLKGHTNCSLGYKINDKLFCGDVVFVDSIGRMDLPTASEEDMLKTLMKLGELTDIDELYCGHGAVCPYEDFKTRLPIYLRYIKMQL